MIWGIFLLFFLFFFFLLHILAPHGPTMWVRSFSSVQDGMCAPGKAHYVHYTQSLRSWNRDWLTVVALSHFKFKEDHWVLPLSVLLYTRWFMVLIILSFMPTVSQAPQHFRSEMQATCNHHFAWYSAVCSVIFLDFAASRTVHPLESWKVDVAHWHMLVWDFHSAFHFLQH